MKHELCAHLLKMPLSLFILVTCVPNEHIEKCACRTHWTDYLFAWTGPISISLDLKINKIDFLYMVLSLVIMKARNVTTPCTPFIVCFIQVTEIVHWGSHWVSGKGKRKIPKQIEGPFQAQDQEGSHVEYIFCHSISCDTFSFVSELRTYAFDMLNRVITPSEYRPETCWNVSFGTRLAGFKNTCHILHTAGTHRRVSQCVIATYKLNRKYSLEAWVVRGKAASRPFRFTCLWHKDLEPRYWATANMSWDLHETNNLGICFTWYTTNRVTIPIGFGVGLFSVSLFHRFIVPFIKCLGHIKYAM